VALLTEIPAPYRIPLFNALATRVELDVLYLRERNPERGHYRLHEGELRFGRRVLPGRDATVAGRWLVLNRGVARALREAAPNAVVLGGWNQPTFWRAAVYARRHRLPLVLWIENTVRDSRARGPKRILARTAAAFVVPGRASEEYVRAVRPDARVVVAPNAVDVDLYASGRAERNRVRDELDLHRVAVLYVGRLAPEKGVDVLVAAAGGLDADVLVAGSGRVLEVLRADAPANVRFLGDVDRDDLPTLYAAADVLCLPSRSEPWGMTLNEGAAAGLALVASDAAGAARELVREGENGYVVPAGDVAALRSALAALAADPDMRARMGRRSLEISAQFTAEAWADAVAGVVSTLVPR
jgi:glycosyltransferase involved in cell wall biosynthesis